ncbi:MAG: hypothetical protein J6X65_02025 [Bacteroidales bacterium]|nr:hypothetical protein [Bacteroidales bacterium]
MDTRTPVKSSMGFVSPDAIVSPSPSIRNLVHDPAPKNVAPAPTTIPTPAATEPAIVTPEPTPTVTESAIVETRQGTSLQQNTEPTPAETEPTIVETRQGTSLQQQQNDTPIQDVETPQQPASSPVENPENYFEKFKEQWDAMVDNVFSKVPTLLTPLKNYPLEVKNNVVYLKLRNSMQVDDFSIKKVAVLQYLRNHFDPNINDVEVSIDDKTELKKYILDEKDKIQELQHQNPDFAEFMQTLHLQSCN